MTDTDQQESSATGQLVELESGVTTRNQLCQCGTTFQQRGIKNPVSRRVFGWSPVRCPACEETQRATEAREVLERKQMVAEDLQRRALKNLAVPPLYASSTLARFEMHGSPAQQAQLLKIKELACQFVSQWPIIPESQELLLFQGSYGSGKGHIAWSIARALAAGHAAQVRVVKLAAVIRDLREPWRDKESPSEDARLTRYRDLELLVIDEVSRHAFYGNKVTQHLYDIIDDRIEQHRPTILTTNEDAEGIAEILGPALMSRLNGAGGVIQFPAVDWRSREVQTSAIGTPG